MAKKRKLYVKETQMENTQETTQVESQALQEAIDQSTTEDTIVLVEEPTVAPEATVEDTVTEPVVEAAIAVAAEPTPMPVEAPAAVSEYSVNLTQLLALVKQTQNPAVINYIDELLQYTKRMAPGQTMNQEAGAMNQAGLYTTLVNIIDHSGADFRIAFSTLLCIVHDYRNAAFSGAYALRFMESVSLNAPKRKALIKMINLLSMAANPKTRKAALKHIDLKREVISPFSEESRMRIDAYFKN
jgi:hypothetical protein